MTANGNRQDERNKNMANSTLDALRSAYAPESLEADLNERLIQAALAGFSSANGQQPPVISRPIFRIQHRQPIQRRLARRTLNKVSF